MNPEQQTQTHSEPAGERPASTAQNQNRRRHRGGRSRHKRGGRGPRAEQRGEPIEREQEGRDGQHEPVHAEETHAYAHAHAETHTPAHRGKPSGTIRRAIDQVEQIRRELQKVLEEMNEVLQKLHQAEREKNAAEDEIEMLAESLHLLKRDSAGQRNQPYRSAPSPKSPSSTSEKGSEPEVSSEEH